MDNYLVAGCKPWNRKAFDAAVSELPGRWHYIGGPEELTLELLQDFAPRYVFFLHWSWIVPPEIFQRYECVVFHMTDVPYGRGGSPLQNLIVRGHRKTRLTALRMADDLDAGPMYIKKELSLEGTAEEIYARSSHMSMKMAKRIVDEGIEPVPQSGSPIVFKRRKPEESLIPALPNLEALQDYIRMLDAEGYPHAFLEHQGMRYEFRRAALYDGRIVADVTITPVGSEA